MPPVQYLNEKISKIRNIQKTIIFHIFANKPSNKMKFIKKKKKSEQVPHPPSETEIGQRRFFVQKKQKRIFQW